MATARDPASRKRAAAGRAAQRKKQTEKPRWRDAIQVHPECEKQPPPRKDTLKGLAVDLAEHGQREPIKLWRGTEDNVLYLVDGRSRLDALELIGVQAVTAKGTFTKQVTWETVKGDPRDLVRSWNLHRRHLTR